MVSLSTSNFKICKVLTTFLIFRQNSFSYHFIDLTLDFLPVKAASGSMILYSSTYIYFYFSHSCNESSGDGELGKNQWESFAKRKKFHLNLWKSICFYFLWMSLKIWLIKISFHPFILCHLIVESCRTNSELIWPSSLNHSSSPCRCLTEDSADTNRSSSANRCVRRQRRSRKSSVHSLEPLWRVQRTLSQHSPDMVHPAQGIHRIFFSLRLLPETVAMTSSSE